MIQTVAARCPLCGPDFPRGPVAQGVDFEYGTVPDTFSVVSCRTCGTWMLDPRPTDEELPRLYPESYEPYHFDRLPGLVRRGRDLVQRRKVDMLSEVAPPGARIVDVGCGGGALLDLMRRFGPKDWTLAGWDFPGPHLERVAAAGFETIQGPVTEDALPPASVDVFVLNQVLEHFAHPGDVVAALAKLLKPGGALVIETPSTEGLDAKLFGRRYWGGFHFPRHLVLFHGAALTELLRRHGLEARTAQSLPSPAFWIQSFHHAASERPGTRALASLFTLRNPLAVALATGADLLRAPFAPTSNMRVVARKPRSPS